MAIARRGGRAAKGGRLKICSRRSSQVRILAPAFVLADITVVFGSAVLGILL